MLPQELRLRAVEEKNIHCPCFLNKDSVATPLRICVSFAAACNSIFIEVSLLDQEMLTNGLLETIALSIVDLTVPVLILLNTEIQPVNRRV